MNASPSIGQPQPSGLYALPWVMLAVAAAAHVALLFYDFSDPDAFLRADRAALRLTKVEAITDPAADVVWYLSTHGVLGDYVVHALLFAAGGKLLTLCAQLALLLLSAVATFRLCETLGLSRRACTIGMAFFLLLPHSIVFPHQLSSEAIHVPLLIVSTWVTVLATQRRSLRLLLFGGVLLAIATLIRPVTLLWPVVVGVALAALWQPRRGIQFAAAAFLPILLWMSFLWQTAGYFGLGEGQASAGRNLYQRVRVISSTLPEHDRAEIEQSYLNKGERGTLGVGDYLSFGLRYPVPFAAHLARDSVVFFIKSGVEKLTIDYLGGGESFRNLNDDEGGGWRTRLQRDGPIATGLYLWEQLGVVLLISGFGALCMALWLLAAALGSVRVLRRLSQLRTEQVLAALLLTLLPLYVFAVSQVVDVMQSRLRAPAEFALVVLGAYGVYAYWHQFKASRARAAEVNAVQARPSPSANA